MSRNTVRNLFDINHYKVKIVKKKLNYFQYIISVLSYALFIFLMLIGITLVIYVVDVKVRASRGDFSNPKFGAYVVLTGSMIPTINPNDIIVIKNVAPEKIKQRDIITFRSSDVRFAGTIITHRVLDIANDSNTKEYEFITKGDNNNVADNATAKAKDVMGKVILRIPYVGYIQYFLATKGGWIIVIFIPCAIIISYDIFKIFKKAKRSVKKKIKIAK